VSGFTQTIQEVPSAGLIPVGLLFVCGLVLWLAGRRVMRPGFAATGLIVGGALGWGIGEAGDLGVAPWVAGAVGAVLAAMVAAMAYRLALAGVVGLLLGTLAPLGVWTAAEHGVFDSTATPAEMVDQTPLFADQPAPEGGGSVETAAGLTDGIDPELAEWLENIFRVENNPPPVQAINVTEETRAALTWLEGIATDVVEAAKAVWAQSPAALRGSLLAAAVAGAMLGFVVGAAAPALSAAAVSALGGSILLLGSAWTIGARLGEGEVPWMPQSATTWTAVWLIIAFLGLAIQWMFRPKRADNSAS
jgi:hypothetical protein